MKKIRIYLIARISKDAHDWNNKITYFFDQEKIEVFKPHEHNPWNDRHETFAKKVFDTDLDAIKKSHIGLCLPEFGNDCSWECGWYSNSRKPLVAFVDNQTAWLRDWMVKGGINFVVTNNRDTFEKLKNDPILKYKTIVLINNMQELTATLEKIHKQTYQNNFMHYFLNARPYSWIDLVMLGYLAKFSITKTLSFSISDSPLLAGLLCLWLFFNFILEKKHAYDYRGSIAFLPAMAPLLIATTIGFLKNPSTILPVLISTILIAIYLQKNMHALLGNFACIVRGLIESSYFIFAVLFFSKTISLSSIVLSVVIFLVFIARSLIGDIRDIKHNKIANKKTFPVTFGIAKSIAVISLLLITTGILIVAYFGQPQIATPLLLLCVGFLFTKNGFILHQLSILTTSFFFISLIALMTNQNIFFFNLIFLGIWMNMIFYPLLERKSNPRFI
ncbi:MAG: hypothetical protein ACD_8C00028G0001 [uncultured bacterium]|nr:MAG: hypothetical protein ACD_8C00028G0001 [uncultured bacterium]